MRVEGKVSVAWDRKVVHRERIQRLGGLDLRWDCLCCAKFGQTIRNEEDEHDEGAVRRPFDLKVAEEGIGTEEIEGLVYDVRLFWVGYRQAFRTNLVF